MLLEARRLAPNVSYVPINLAKTYMVMGRYDKVREQVMELRRIKATEFADAYEGAADFLESNFSGSESVLSRFNQLSVPGECSRGASRFAALLCELGRYKQAIQVLKNAIQHDAEHDLFGFRADKLVALAYIYLRTGQREACRDACLAAIELDPGPDRAMQAGSLLARAGFCAEAAHLLKLIPGADSIPRFAVDAHRLRGEIALSRNASATALEEFRQADKLDALIHHREYLARALERAGHLDAAFVVYKRIIDSPGVIWEEVELNPPGITTDEILGFAKIAQSSKKNEEYARAWREYAKRRPNKHNNSTFGRPD